jgi:hypothetical protein
MAKKKENPFIPGNIIGILVFGIAVILVIYSLITLPTYPNTPSLNLTKLAEIVGAKKCLNIHEANGGFYFGVPYFRSFSIDCTFSNNLTKTYQCYDTCDVIYSDGGTYKLKVM